MIGCLRILCAACVAVMLCQPSHAIDGLDIDAEGRLFGDSNVGNAVESDDEEASFRTLGSVRLSYSQVLGESSRLRFWLRAGGEYFSNIEDLSNIFAQGHADYEFSLSSGPFAPVFTLLAEVTGVDVNSEIRDSVNFRLGAEVRAQLTPQLSLGGGAHGVFNNADSDVFTTKDFQLFTQASYAIWDSGALFGNLTYKYGDITSTGTPTLDIIKASDEVIPDGAFGGLEANQLAYRLRANTFIVTAGYNHSFAQRLSLDFSLRGIFSIATEDSDLTYERYQAILRFNILL